MYFTTLTCTECLQSCQVFFERVPMWPDAYSWHCSCGHRNRLYIGKDFIVSGSPFTDARRLPSESVVAKQVGSR